MITKKPELLCPAGTFKNMQYAFAYGADAVYAGQARYSLRVRNNDFDEATLKKGIDYAHSLNKKFYVVANIQAHNAKIRTFIDDIAPIVAMKPDALIMSDTGMIMMVREAFPDMEIHLSVQANAVNWATVKFWQQQGISRVILSRELSLTEIKQICAEVPDMEIEIFVHGALCMAYSGRCLLSGYINKRDANQGTCTNACRWSYSAHPATENEAGDIVTLTSAQKYNPAIDSALESPVTHSDEVVLLEEKSRPGELMPMYEDEHGTYIMNSKDLRAVELVPDLVNMGVSSLKIEGRTKSHYYVARTAQVYNQAINDAVAGKPFDTNLMTSLDSLANRGYTEGFLRRHVHSSYQNYDFGASKTDNQQFVAEVIETTETGRLKLAMKNKLTVGDVIEIMTPKGNVTLELIKMWDRKGNTIDVAPGSGWEVQIPNPFTDITDTELQFALIVKNLSTPIYT
ncbi:MAG: tRNA 5-hydroxyuridine modification protein YegQ [Gammaproteobacteria bacterium]|nr:tRNA 5-hydroxyuridine modification protein YegQ [Gammaproteobacteria bacterium]